VLSLTHHRTQVAHAALLGIELAAAFVLYTGRLIGTVMTILIVALVATSVAAGRTSISLDRNTQP
jgi:hypothetical protein